MRAYYASVTVRRPPGLTLFFKSVYMNLMKNDLNTDPFPIVSGAVQVQPVHTSPVSEFGTYFQLFFLAAAGWMAVVYGKTEAFTTFSIIFSSIILEAFPFMLLGALLGGCVEVFLSREQLVRILPESPVLSIVMAAFMGICFPVCECAIVPVVRKFLQKGMPLGAAVAFLLGGPIVNPLVFSSTLVAYSLSWDVPFLRTFIGAFIAIGIGMFVHMSVPENQGVVPGSADHHGCSHGGSCSCVHSHENYSGQPFFKKITAALSHAALDFYDIGKFLVIGAFIAAFLQTIISRQAFFSMASGAVTSIGLMMILAVVLNLCSEADAFIAASLAPIGVPFSAQMAFMVLGPMLDIKLIIMYLGVFTKKMIIILIASTLIFVFFAMLFMHFALSTYSQGAVL